MFPMKSSSFPIRVAAGLLLAGLAQVASADGLSSLESFMRNARSGKADFTQTVTSPSRDGQAARTKVSTGTFEYLRPGKFKFDYRKPFPQLIVADGSTLWLYDADLKQVTARPQAQALGSTPAALIASAPDLQALRKDFMLQSQPEADGLQWVLATPRTKDGQLQSIRVGFRGDQLAALDILDSFGQRSAMVFANLQANPSLPASTFDFQPPSGTDVVWQ
jgi:outer membrane lipoprotein carrier protein